MSHGVLHTHPAGCGGLCWQDGGQCWKWECRWWQWECEGKSGGSCVLLFLGLTQLR